MKAEELTIDNLMVGDWIRTPHGIRTIEQINREAIYYDSDNRGYVTCIKNIEPIPITPEILLKNGFTHDCIRWDGRDTYALFTQEHFVINIDKQDRGTYYVYIENLDREKEIVLYNAKCIHEFQHALRFCGIEKEIKL